MPSPIFKIDLSKLSLNSSSIIFNKNQRCCIVSKIQMCQPRSLLVDPAGSARFVRSDSLREPHTDFVLGGFDRVTSVADVAADLNAEIPTNGSHSRFGRHGGTKHLASLQDNVLSFPDHSTDRSGGHVRDKTREELFVFQVFVVLFLQL